MAAFGTNAMLLAQFPHPTVREKLQTCIAAKALADIADPNIAVLVVRNDVDGADEVISFAKWNLPARRGEVCVEAPWLWPEGTDKGVLEEWSGIMEEAKGRVLGEEDCYRESDLGIYVVLFSNALQIVYEENGGRWIVCGLIHLSFSGVVGSLRQRGYRMR